MARLSEAERLEKLRQKKAAIERKLATLDAAHRKRKRAEDTRRKVLAGACALHHAEQDAARKAALWGELDAFLTRPDDRALFGLPPREGEAAESGGASAAGAEDSR